jgi:hypothetical protein
MSVDLLAKVLMRVTPVKVGVVAIVDEALARRAA